MERGSQIFGPLFYRRTVKCDVYLATDSKAMPSLLNPEAEDLGWFEQDVSAPHCVAVEREYLDYQFPVHRIGRRSSVEGPLLSLHLTPLDINF